MTAESKQPKQNISSRSSLREERRQARRQRRAERLQRRHEFYANRLIWGFILILIGVLFLLQNFNVLTIDWSNLWRLWPLFIVLAGVSMLSARGWFGRLLMILVGVGVAVLVALSLLGFIHPRGSDQTSSPANNNGLENSPQDQINWQYN